MELLDHVHEMSDAAHSIAIAASRRVQGVRGRVSVSATDTYAAYILPPIIERIRREAPEIAAAIMSSNALANLRHQEADIAIPHVAPDHPPSSVFICAIPMRCSMPPGHGSSATECRPDLKIWRGRTCCVSKMPNDTSRISAGSASQWRPRRCGWYRITR